MPTDWRYLSRPDVSCDPRHESPGAQPAPVHIENTALEKDQADDDGADDVVAALDHFRDLLDTSNPSQVCLLVADEPMCGERAML